MPRAEASAAGSVVKQGTWQRIAALRMYESSYSLRRPEGVFRRIWISWFTMASTMCGGPSWILLMGSAATPCAARTLAVPRVARMRNPSARDRGDGSGASTRARHTLPRSAFFLIKVRMKTLGRRPVLYGVAAFLLTVAVMRSFAYFFPMVGRWHFSSGLHLHHYVFGIFVLTIAGGLALIFKGPRATFGIALLYGLGVGLTYDEFGYWVSPRYGRGAGANVRWDNTGLLIVGGAFLVAGLLSLVARRRRRPNPDAASSPPG
jgi:hypothetical protein